MTSEDNTAIEIIKITRRLDSLEGDVAVLKTDVAILKTDVSALKTDVSTLKDDMVYVKGQMDVLVDLLSKILRLNGGVNDDE